MGFQPRATVSWIDPENFPPARGTFELVMHGLDGVKMPDFIKDQDLRKGPRRQNTLTWMNAVQACLDDHTSWDRRLNGKIGVRVHNNIQTCQVARISPRSIESRPIKTQADYIKEDLRPTIELLVSQEKMRMAELTKLRAENEKKTQESGGPKRKIEEDQQDQQHTIKKRKQEDEKRVDDIMDGPHALRKTVNEQVRESLPGVRRAFHDFEGEVPRLMTAEK